MGEENNAVRGKWRCREK